MVTSGIGEDRGSDGRSRVDFVLAIESVGELYTGLAPRLSTDGLYIETDEPVPEGSEVGFRVTLPDGVVVIHGRGHVTWVRSPDAANDPTGLAIRFSHMDPEARETLDAVIDAHLGGGGVLFDLDEGSLGEETFPTDSLDTPVAPTSGPRWIRDDGSFPAADSPASPAHVTGTPEEDPGVGDLRFKQTIARFAAGQGSETSFNDQSLDDAIAAAVGLTPGVGDQSDAGAATPAAAADATAAVDDVIPGVLDQWRRELEIAGQGPSPSQGDAESPTQALEWESLLPFDPDETPELGSPAPWTQPDSRTTSARRDEGETRRSGGWWMIALAAMAVVVVGVAVAMLVRQSSDELPTTATQVAEVTEVAVDPPAQLPEAVEIEANIEAETTPDPAPVAKPVKPPATATHVQSITWRADAGQTAVVIHTDGTLDNAAIDAIRLDDPPRVLVRVRGMDRPFTPHRFEVASAEVSAIRVGYHPELRPAAVYVVLDLASDEVSSKGALSVAGPQAVVTVRTGS